MREQKTNHKWTTTKQDERLSIKEKINANENETQLTIKADANENSLIYPKQRSYYNNKN